MASTPQFASTPNIGQVTISTANTNRDGTGTLGTAFTAGASGSTVTRMTVTATGTTTAGVVRVFVNTGATYSLVKEILVTAITPSTTVEAFREQVVFDPPLCLPTSYLLKASTHNAESFAITTEGGNF